MGYLKYTKQDGIVYDIYKEKKDDLTIHVYSDAAFAQDPDTSRSRTGVVAICYGAAIYWKSVLQSTIAGSTGESEYMAIYQATTAALHMREQLMCAIKGWKQCIPIYVDNVAAIILATTEEIKTLMKHIRVKYHLIRQRHQMKEIDVVSTPTPTDKQIADIMTKNLPKDAFERHKQSMMGTVISIQELQISIGKDTPKGDITKEEK